MKTYLGLGSNLGNKKANINHAIRKIEEQVGELIRKSDYHSSAPQGFVSDHDFVNAVALVETNYLPLDLLRLLQGIERELGRKQKNVDGVYADRIIDIDILLYEDWVVDLPELKVPHPLMKERDFVVKPLNEILG